MVKRHPPTRHVSRPAVFVHQLCLFLVGAAASAGVLLFKLGFVWSVRRPPAVLFHQTLLFLVGAAAVNGFFNQIYLFLWLMLWPPAVVFLFITFGLFWSLRLPCCGFFHNPFLNDLGPQLGPMLGWFWTKFLTPTWLLILTLSSAQFCSRFGPSRSGS